MQTRNTFSWIKEQITRSISVSLMLYIITRTSISSAYPIFAQQGYENPREATGRIVCANCHLANKPVDIEVPQAVLPDTVFEAVVRIPYDKQVKQVLANGGNRGRGQIYPDGSKSNNTIYNATGAGIGDAEIVLQDPLRVQGLLFFLASVILAQIFLVLKKKQFEKVQLAEMNF
ncbi:UNVERIFIED_CONTAM: Cytochrome f [Sesamum indicum]